jgi:NAD(P)-dependent dehydrogenase (short-subunit alcohol dehydrogenase family)
MPQTKKTRPPQTQKKQPGIETKMTPRPKSFMREYVGSGKLKNKVALVTGGDSGIGRALSIAFAKEGADLVIVYRNEHGDMKDTLRAIEATGRRCITVAGDIGKMAVCRLAVRKTIGQFGRLDVLVNNAAEQHPQKSIEAISSRQLQRTFSTNVFAMFYMIQAALSHMKAGARIINTTSVTAYRGSPHLLDYSATKGAIVALTRSLALALAERGIYVNGVAPGPVWTPLIPASFDSKKVASFGSDVALKRPGEPDEIAPSFVFLASDDSSYMTGQVLHPNGGEIING